MLIFLSMKYHLSIVMVLTVFLITGGAASSHADQNDSRLDTLFGQLHQTDNYGEASEIVEQIWTVWTENDDPDAHFEIIKGVESMAHQNYEAALLIFDHVVKNHPEFAEAWNKRATVLYLMGRYDESLRDVHVTLELEPRHFGALSGKGLIFMVQGEYIEAIKAFEHALETNPHMPGIRMRIEKLHDVLDKNAI